MILEALLPCPSCGTRNAVPAIAPFVWWYLMTGKRCYECGCRFSVADASQSDCEPPSRA